MPITAHELAAHYGGTGLTLMQQYRLAQLRADRKGTCISCGRFVADHFDQSNRKLSCAEAASRSELPKVTR